MYTSRLSDSIKPVYSSLRTEFGIIDPFTGKKYADIKRAYIIRTLLSSQQLYGYQLVEYDGTKYNLSLDSALRDLLRKQTNVVAIISLQQRDDINIAIARIDDISRQSPNMKGQKIL